MIDHRNGKLRANGERGSINWRSQGGKIVGVGILGGVN